MDCLNKNAQACLIRTCRYLHRLLDVQLYRHIQPAYARTRFQNNCLTRTLVDRQDLLPFILTYHGPLLSIIIPPEKRSFLDSFKTSRNPQPKTFSILPINETEGFKRAVTIFTNATNIVDLQLTDSFAWASDPQFETIKHAIASMSLKRLSLWNCNDLLPVLQDQPELEELRLKWCSATLENLEKTDVPKLRHLSAELHQAACLVPGRPIEHLRLDTGFGALHFDEQLFDKLSLSAKPITEFSGILICPWEDEMTRSAIRAIARNLPNVERLTLDIGGSISGLVILEEMTSLKCIQSLVFLGASLGPSAHRANSNDDQITQVGPSISDWDDLFTRLKDRCPSLAETRWRGI